MELAQAAEAAEKNARQLEKATTAGVNKVSLERTKEGGAHRPPPTTTPCYRCGGRHPSDKCRFKDSDCHHCGISRKYVEVKEGRMHLRTPETEMLNQNRGLKTRQHTTSRKRQKLNTPMTCSIYLDYEHPHSW